MAPAKEAVAKEFPPFEKLVDLYLEVIDYTHTNVLSGSIVTILKFCSKRITMEIGIRVVVYLKEKHERMTKDKDGDARDVDNLFNR